MSKRIIELKSSLVRKSIFLPIGILIFLITYNIFSERKSVDLTVILYFISGTVFVLMAFEREFFGIQRYIKTDENFLEYKRFPLSPKLTINLNDIEKIQIRAFKIYIYTNDGSIHLINTDWLTGSSQIETAEFFKKHFPDKIEIFTQKDYFTKRYNKKIEKLKKEGKL